MSRWVRPSQTFCSINSLYSMSCLSYWCERRDSNSHGLPHRILNPARLPVPPLSHTPGIKRRRSRQANTFWRLPPEPVQGNRKNLVGRQGFEPRTDRLRADCSAAELTPRFLLTANILSAGHTLYVTVKWGGRWDSNPRRLESQSRALPTELRPP